MLKYILKKCYFNQIIFFIYSALFYFIHLISNSNKSDDIWIIGENGGECLKDNSYCFYKYCRKNHPQLKIFFIIDKQSINYNSFLQKDANVIHYGTLRHIIFFLKSNTCIFSTAHRDIAYKLIFRLYKKKCKKIFLDHGIMGFKKMNVLYSSKNNAMDLFCVSSNIEKEIVDNNFDFNNNISQITGLARYDRLTNTKVPSKRSILYIPTWREWALTNIDETIFFDKISSLLNNNNLLKLLSINDIKFIFYPHKNMRKYLDHIKVNNIITIVRPGEETVQKLIIDNALMITDYSSVSWDFYYLKKPVLFYQFDQEEYLNKRGSYLDLNKDVFGEIYKNEDKLIYAIEQYITTGYRELKKYKTMRDTYFKFHDNKNCHRIFHAIKQMS